MIPSLPFCIVAPIAGTVHAVLIALTMIFWIRTSIIDPADKHVLKKIHDIVESLVEDGKMKKSSGVCSCLYAAMNKPVQTMPKGSSYGSTKFCSLCDSDVHVDSAHCLRCGMCVYRYDHHCSSKFWKLCSRRFNAFFVAKCLMLYTVDVPLCII
jgi:DHHC palmitoyltransferase